MIAFVPSQTTAMVKKVHRNLAWCLLVRACNAEKLHLQRLVTIIADIADLSEDAGDELEFAAMKSVI